VNQIKQLISDHVLFSGHAHTFHLELNQKTRILSLKQHLEYSNKEDQKSEGQKSMCEMSFTYSSRQNIGHFLKHFFAAAWESKNQEPDSPKKSGNLKTAPCTKKQ
jgi:hypothetical protein